MPRDPFNTDYATGHSPADARSPVQRSQAMHPDVRHLVLEQARPFVLVRTSAGNHPPGHSEYLP